MAVRMVGAEWQEYVDTLALWNMGGSPDPVMWAGRAEEDRKDYLPHLTPKQIKQALYDFARQGGRIDRVDETREEYRNTWTYHYDLWPTIEGAVYYFETRFDRSTDPDESVIYIMRFKPDKR
jgi:hypothetical protein